MIDPKSTSEVPRPSKNIALSMSLAVMALLSGTLLASRQAIEARSAANNERVQRTRADQRAIVSNQNEANQKHCKESERSFIASLVQLGAPSSKPNYRAEPLQIRQGPEPVRLPIENPIQSSVEQLSVLPRFTPIIKVVLENKRQPEATSKAIHIPRLEVTRDTTLDPKKTYGKIVIKASGVRVDGQGALVIGDLNVAPNKRAGVGIEATDVSDVVLTNIKVKGFEIGLKVERGQRWSIEDGDFSDNFHDPEFGWGEQGRRGGILLIDVESSTIRHCRANRVWDGCVLFRSQHNLIEDNDFSHTSNTCLKLWNARNNRILSNKLDYGIRKKPDEVHARDSTCVLIESGSDENHFEKNSCTHGGDGIFIRSLNQWISTGNLFLENDCSSANNNCVECWSPGNRFIKNKANSGSYGFWMGGSDKSVLIENEASDNGLAKGNHNSPHLPDKGFAGIVFMFGTSNHVQLQGNICNNNNGAGIALIGDLDSQGKKWKAYHALIQDNQLERNRWGIYLKHADFMQLAGNRFVANSISTVKLDGGTSNIVQRERPTTPREKPKAKITGPSFLKINENATFEANSSLDPHGHSVTYRWDFGDNFTTSTGRVERSFNKPGLYRVACTVANDTYADLGWLEIYVASPEPEIGTELMARHWRWDDPASKVQFTNDDKIKLHGAASLLAHVKPYSGRRCNLWYDHPAPAGISLKGKKTLSFWIRAENDNTPTWQNENPIITIKESNHKLFILTPTKEVLLDLAKGTREGWLRVEVPLQGNKDWIRAQPKGVGDIDTLRSLGLGFDSWGGDPLKIWIDGVQLLE